MISIDPKANASRILPACTVQDVERNFETVLTRIRLACERAGRNPLDVRLLPVSKMQDERVMRMAYAAGLRWFGESKVQEAKAKCRSMADLPELRWSFIGHLQTNKAGMVARFASEFHGLDSVRVAQALNIGLINVHRELDVYVQVNTSGEESKHGIHPDALESFLDDLSGMHALRVKGLMTMAMQSSDTREVRKCFSMLRRLRERARINAAPDIGLAELSMGMSGDFEIAIEEGATIVRVGQALFGARAVNDDNFEVQESSPP